MDEKDKVRVAAQRVDAEIGFYIHAAIFVAVITVLFVVNLMASSIWWVQWPFLGWGAGLIAHGALVFWSAPTVLRDWRLRRIETVRKQL